MSSASLDRRDFLKSFLMGLPMITLDWEAFPKGKGTTKDLAENKFDAIVIGAGLGGLSCGAAFARQGFKVLVLEKHDKPGGYATVFRRPGGFSFDVSLHSTVPDERNGVRNLIPGFPEIEDFVFVPHPNVYRVIYPDDDIRVPARDVPGYIKMLTDRFPGEREGIAGIFEDMKGLVKDINKYSQAQGRVNMAQFPTEFPYLFKSFGKTWGALVDLRIKDPKLKGIISSLWAYYGLPPSKVSTYYYAMPTVGYLEEGGYYPVGRSQKISDAFMKFISARGGEVKLWTNVERILVKDQAAYGVGTADGKEYVARVVVSNANAYDTFHKMIGIPEIVRDYLGRMDKLSPSLSSFQVFLGLKKDLVKELDLKDTEVFYNSSYDIEADYLACLKGDVGGGYCATLYDNLYKGYSPEGKNTLILLTLQGYEPWAKFEAGYFAGKKQAYQAEKNRMADILIDAAEETLLPGLRKAIEVREVGTPLTNVRYTGNYRGAIYGWDQTVDNSGPQRLPHKTPIKNLYLAGAWTSPGAGYGAVIPSGLQCFGEIMKEW